jgi:Cu/Zn superoxide dismutase
MAAIINMTSFDAALKVRYPDMALKLMSYKNNPLLAMLPKDESGWGKNITVPVNYGAVQGRSATFTSAGSNKFSSSYDDFVVTRVKNYARADIDNETLLASQGDGAAFLRAATSEIDRAMHSLTRDLASDVYRSGSGSRGRISSVSSAIVTLCSVADIVNFEVGMSVELTTTEYKSSASHSKLTITSVDRNAGTFQVASGTYTAGNAGAHIHQHGDRSGGPASLLKLAGLAGWLPATAPTGSWFGVTRSVDSTRLAGIRVDGTGQTVEEALIKAAVFTQREGASPKHAFMNPEHMGDLCKTLSDRKRFDSVKAHDANISFDSVQMWTAAGAITVVPDHNCPKGVAYLLDLDTWKLHSIGAAPRIIQTDGLRVLRNSGTDSVEVRCGYYGNLVCYAPGSNARVSLDV